MDIVLGIFAITTCVIWGFNVVISAVLKEKRDFVINVIMMIITIILSGFIIITYW